MINICTYGRTFLLIFLAATQVNADILCRLDDGATLFIVGAMRTGYTQADFEDSTHSLTFDLNKITDFEGEPFWNIQVFSLTSPQDKSGANLKLSVNTFDSRGLARAELFAAHGYWNFTHCEANYFDP